MTSPRLRLGDPAFDEALTARFDADVADVLRLSATLCAEPGITVPADAVAFEPLLRTWRLASDFARSAGLRVLALEPSEAAPYPFLVVGFAEQDLADPAITELVALVGHLDVVPPREEDQFRPALDGVDLYARGAADMKTVVATWLVWMARRQARPGPKPPLVLMLSCCEENGSAAPHHMGSVLDLLHDRWGVTVRFALVGERTGELEWMSPEPLIGPICKENRSWRWLRSGSDTEGGLETLRRVAAAVGEGRRVVHQLNTEAVPAVKAGRQPGVRSGLVNPFAFVVGEVDAGSNPTWIEIERPPGAAIHSAAAGVGDPSLVERLACVAVVLEGAFPGRVRLGGLSIGRDGNFNSYDGSGRLWLGVEGAPLADVLDAAALDADLQGRGVDGPGEVGETLVGIDIRELFDHRDAIEALLEDLRARLWGDRFDLVCSRPPWRCPAAHPDLQRLEAAWEAVVGAPSPDLVKLHGNDGGSLAARQQAEDPAAARAGLGHAVVFGQVGMRPHGAGEFHRGTSVRPYWDVLDRWVDDWMGAGPTA